MISWHETDIEDYVCENYSLIFDNDICFVGRQVNIGIGFIDVLFYDIQEQTMFVLEIKKEEVNNEAITQIMGYLAGVKDYLTDENIKTDFLVKQIKGIIMGPKINDKAATSLRFIQDDVTYMQYVVNLSIKINQITFSRTKETNYKPVDFIKKITEPILDEIEELKSQEQFFVKHQNKAHKDE